METPSPAGYSISAARQAARGLVRGAGRLAYWLLARPEVYGLENVPRRGPYLIAFNHSSIFDPPFLITHWPAAPEVLAEANLWHEKGRKMWVRLYGGIPIHRGQYDRRALEHTLAALRAGARLMIAPEGRVNSGLGLLQGRLGLGWILSQAPVPVVPVGITGSTLEFMRKLRAGERPRVILRIGRALESVPVDSRDKAAMQRRVDTVMAHIAALLPPEERGFYAEMAESVLSGQAGTQL